MRFMYTTDDLFSGSGSDYFHDVFAELDHNMGQQVDRSPKLLRQLFEALPEEIQNIAHSWSLGDTVFRDEAYAYFKEFYNSEI